MDIQRIHREVAQAIAAFALVEAYPTSNGGVFVKAAFQTAAGNAYVAAVYFTNYPSQMPTVFITKPNLHSACPHQYREGNICYLHPNMWNPGLHDLCFVLKRTAKWLSKYEVWRVKGNWPGAEIRH